MTGIPELIGSAYNRLLELMGPEETLVLLIGFISIQLLINTLIFLIRHMFTAKQRQIEKEENRQYERAQKEKELSDGKIKESSREFSNRLNIVHNHLTNFYKQYNNTSNFEHFEEFLSSSKGSLLEVNQYFNSNQKVLDIYTEQYQELISAWENQVVVCAKKITGTDFSIITALHGIDLDPPKPPPSFGSIATDRLRSVDRKSPYILPIIFICFVGLIVLSFHNPNLVTIFACTLLVLLFILLFTLVLLVAKTGSIKEILETLLPLFSEDTRIALANAIYTPKAELTLDANAETIANMKSALSDFEKALVAILQNANDNT